MILGGDQLFCFKAAVECESRKQIPKSGSRARADMEAEMHELLGQERKDWTCTPSSMDARILTRRLDWKMICRD